MEGLAGGDAVRNINFNQGDFAWVSDWILKGGWWVRYALVQPYSVPSIETIGYDVLDDGQPKSHDSHEEARQYEEDKLLAKIEVTQ